MPSVQPTYTPDNCRPAYQLNWSLTVFWHSPAAPAECWLEGLRSITETDDVRILEHRLVQPSISQFLLSTKPHIAPSAATRVVKGRLHHLVREGHPKAFQRNYTIRSVGSANAQAIEKYVASQIEHHPMANPRLNARLARFRFQDASMDLSIERGSAHGKFVYNLHLVFVYRDRATEVTEEWLDRTMLTVRQIAQKKNHLLFQASPVANHIHLTLGCDVSEAPGDVALSYMNNLAYVHGGRKVFDFGYFAGTFGNYDLCATRR